MNVTNGFVRVSVLMGCCFFAGNLGFVAEVFATDVQVQPSRYPVEDALEKQMIPLFRKFVDYSNLKDALDRQKSFDGNRLSLRVSELQTSLDALHLDLYATAWTIGELEFQNTSANPRAAKVIKLRDLLMANRYEEVLKMRLALGQSELVFDGSRQRISADKLWRIAETCLYYVRATRKE